MSPYHAVLTAKDYMILEEMLKLAAACGDPIVPMLRLKLSNAWVVLSRDVDADVVTLNSRVVFRVDGGLSHTRIVVRSEENAVMGMTIPITIPRGLALLGMRAGVENEIETIDESQETIRVEAVEYQPEAHQRRLIAERPQSKISTSSATIFPRETLASRRRAKVHTLRKADDLDPGPSAA